MCIGEIIALVVPGMGEIKSQVRWVADDKVGFYFIKEDTSIDQRRARIRV